MSRNRGSFGHVGHSTLLRVSLFIILASVAFLLTGCTSTNNVTVPNVVGMTQTNAQAAKGPAERGQARPRG